MHFLIGTFGLCRIQSLLPIKILRVSTQLLLASSQQPFNSEFSTTNNKILFDLSLLDYSLHDKNLLNLLSNTEKWI